MVPLLLIVITFYSNFLGAVWLGLSLYVTGKIKYEFSKFYAIRTADLFITTVVIGLTAGLIYFGIMTAANDAELIGSVRSVIKLSINFLLFVGATYYSIGFILYVINALRGKRFLMPYTFNLIEALSGKNL